MYKRRAVLVPINVLGFIWSLVLQVAGFIAMVAVGWVKLGLVYLMGLVVKDWMPLMIKRLVLCTCIQAPCMGNQLNLKALGRIQLASTHHTHLRK